jgi:hypothetical protein
MKVLWFMEHIDAYFIRNDAFLYKEKRFSKESNLERRAILKTMVALRTVTIFVAYILPYKGACTVT